MVKREKKEFRGGVLAKHLDVILMGAAKKDDDEAVECFAVAIALTDQQGHRLFAPYILNEQQDIDALRDLADELNEYADKAEAGEYNV